MPNPTRISDLPLTNPQVGDFVPIARTTGLYPGTYKLFVDQIPAQLFNAGDTATIDMSLNTATRTLCAEVTMVPISKGGTNATTAAQARINLGTVSKAGDSMTGFLTLHANPTQNLHAATKQYVDNANPFVTGMIMMWSGTIATIPSGWALCNGSNGTPNLTDRFIVGASVDDGGQAKTNVTGSLTITGGSNSHGHTGSAQSTTLTINQIPSHSHPYLDYYQNSIGNDCRNVYGRGNLGWELNPFIGGGVASISEQGLNLSRNTTAAGGGEGHSHTVSVNNATTVPPFYALAFIMKL